MSEVARPRVAIIGGGGAMGRLFARLLAPSAREMYLVDLFGSGPRPANSDKALEEIRAGVKRQGVSEPCPLYAGLPSEAEHLLPRADVTLLALGYEDEDSFAATIEGYTPWLPTGSLLVDLGSTKTGPMAVLEQTVPREVGLLGAHPLFGPTVSDLTGLIVAVVDPKDGRPMSPWREWFVGRLADSRMIITPTDAIEHDDAMSFVQALTHFTLLSFAYAFVRLDRDPADLLAFRTPVFEPLLYLAARVANLARGTPETYRAIQTFSTRPDARQAFLEVAGEILTAIERDADDPQALIRLFREYGVPWSPEGHDRRERSVREHFLEMGVRLVDGLNQLRQEIITAAGQVRAVEERRAGQSPRIVVGLVDLDLLAPGKRDVASRIRLRRLNLPLGRVQGAIREAGRSIEESGQDLMIPLARARLLSDGELFAWLYQTNQLVERRDFLLWVPEWFDHEVLPRLLKGLTDGARGQGSQIWDATIEFLARLDPDRSDGLRPARLTLVVVLHPSELVDLRREIQQPGAEAFRASLDHLDVQLDALYREREASGAVSASDRARPMDQLKRARKALLDQRTAEVDRAVRRAAKARVQAICATAIEWLLRHGCRSGVGDIHDQGPE